MELNRVKIYENGTTSFLSYKTLFPTFNQHDQREWMERHWTISLYGAVAYIGFIYFGTEYMKNRKPMDLKRVMAVWNFSLAVFSILGSATVVPEFINVIRKPNGLHHSVCAPCNDISEASVFWGYLFCLSKMAELIDTVFIVLRKRKLIFLHWYHHLTVLLYCFYSYSDEISTARWFIVINFVIHSMMYAYYGLRTIGIWVPKPIAMTITLLQLSQMVVGVIVNGYAFKAKLAGVECSVSHHHLTMAAIMYASYFVLFAHFFRKVYFAAGKRKIM